MWLYCIIYVAEKVSSQASIDSTSSQVTSDTIEEQTSDILRNNYGCLCQSLNVPVNIAKLLHGEILSDQVIMDVLATRESLSDSRSVLLKAVRSAIRSNHKCMELFVTVLRQFQDTAQVGDILFEEYSEFVIEMVDNVCGNNRNFIS